MHLNHGGLISKFSSKTDPNSSHVQKPKILSFNAKSPEKTDPNEPKSAAEIARNRVLAAYSSTVETLKNLPANTRDALMYDKSSSETTSGTPENPSSNYPSAGYQSSAPSTQPYNPETQPNWLKNSDPSSYQRTPIYTQPSSDSAYAQEPQDAQNAQNTQNAQNAQNTQPYNPSQTPTQTAQPYNTTPTPAAYAHPSETSALNDSPTDEGTLSEEWQKYHSAWQDYYKNYYSDYYAKAAETYLATEKLKNERTATGVTKRKRNRRHFAPIFILIFIILAGLFLQYNRLIFAPIMAYVSPSSDPVSTSLEAVDPTVAGAVSPEPRLIIPKLNVDVPIAFDIPLSEVDAAMNRGVAHFAIPGASALPGQIGNLVITGHSAGDIYSSNPYKFIFSGLERLETGDLIYVNYNSVRYTYKMTDRETVEPTNVTALVYETDKPMITLITCTPLGTSRYRLLISAEQISPTYANAEVAPNSDSSSSSETILPGDEIPANAPSFFENAWRRIFNN